MLFCFGFAEELFIVLMLLLFDVNMLKADIQTGDHKLFPGMDKSNDTNTKRKYNHKLEVLMTEVIF